jgi:hypothetical protein
MPNHGWNARSLCVLVLSAASVVAQTAAPAPVKIGSVTVQGSIRSRLEMWDWFQGEANNSYAYSGNILRLAFGQVTPRFDWNIELAAPFLLNLPDDAIAPGVQGQLGLGGNYFGANDRSQNAGMVFPKQAFIRAKAGKNALRLGRFEYVDGTETTPSDATLAWVKRERITQRLIGTFGWTHVGRSYDGLQYTWTRPGTNVTFVSALPTRGVFQVDGWGNLHVNVTYLALTRNHTRKTHSADWRVFGMYYHDWRHVVKTDSRPLSLRQLDFGNIRIGSFGGHYLHTVQTGAGSLDFTVWGVGQTGRWGRLDHGAHAILFEGGWQPKGMPSLRPWLRAGYSRTSGDSNPLDGKHGTFFQILPTPRPYARFPFFNMMNNEDISGMLVIRPHRAVTLRTEVHGLRLTARNDLWYLGGGAFQPWSFGYIGRATGGARGLATLYDVSADYNVNPNWTVSGYYGHARGHSVMRTIYPKGKNGNFGYGELTFRF